MNTGRLGEAKAPVQLQKMVNFNYLVWMWFWLLTTYLKQLKWVFSVFTLEPAIFKVTVPAKGGNCVSEVLGIKQREEKGTEKVAALQRELKYFVSFLVQSVVKRELYSKH